MAFVKIHGFKGKIFVPDSVPGIKKHDCTDCFLCQMCSDERCEACLKSHSKKQLPEKFSKTSQQNTPE